MGLLSERAEKTANLVVMPSTLEDQSRTPGLYRIGILSLCAAIFSFFAALVIAFFWRAQTASYWQPIHLPRMLWASTALILASSATFESGRRAWRHGAHRAASRFMVVTACLGTAFLAAQLTSWRTLWEQGLFLTRNPYSSFFYLFTGLHAAHLLGGLIALFAVVASRNKRRELIDVVCYYWHFMGGLWIGLFAILLLS